MLQLILPETKKAIKREYTLRFFAILCFLLSGVILLWIIASIPSYLSSESTEAVLAKQAEQIENSKQARARNDYETRVKALQAKTVLLKPTQTAYIEILRQISGLQAGGVQISQIVVGSGDQKSVVNLQGIAATRDSLRFLTDAINSSSFFEAVEIPYSSFTKETNLPFALALVIKTKEESSKDASDGSSTDGSATTTNETTN